MDVAFQRVGAAFRRLLHASLPPSMKLRNPEPSIKHEAPGSDRESARRSSATEEVDALEAYLRDELSEQLFDAVDDWLTRDGDATVVYIAGRARGADSHQPNAGVAQLVRCGDASVDLTAFHLDIGGRRRDGAAVFASVQSELNVGVRVTVVQLAWLACLLDRSTGAFEISSSAFQQVEAGVSVAVLDD